MVGTALCAFAHPTAGVTADDAHPTRVVLAKSQDPLPRMFIVERRRSNESRSQRLLRRMGPGFRQGDDRALDQVACKWNHRLTKRPHFAGKMNRK